MASEQINHGADLIALQTIDRVEKCLLIIVQFSWRANVDESAMLSREPMFGDFCAFMSQRSRVSGNRFGRLRGEDSLSRNSRRNVRNRT